MKKLQAPSKGGIYVIVHIPTERRYAGSTSNLPSRFAHHKKLLRNGSHHNKVLQRDWATYGESEFKFEIIRKFQTKYNEEGRWGQERTLIQSIDPALSYNLLSADECRLDADGLKLKPHIVKLHAEHWEAFHALGGVDWLRQVIDRTKPPKPPA